VRKLEQPQNNALELTSAAAPVGAALAAQRGCWADKALMNRKEL